jgi:flagellar biosynthetic protein FliO
MESLEPVAAIVVVLALLGGVLFLLKKRGSASFRLPVSLRDRQIEVLERASLGPQHALHLVRVGGRRMLIATAPGSCHIIDSGEER